MYYIIFSFLRRLLWSIWVGWCQYWRYRVHCPVTTPWQKMCHHLFWRTTQWQLREKLLVWRRYNFHLYISD